MNILPENTQNIEPPPPLFALVPVWQPPFPSSIVQNLTSTPLLPPFTATPQKNRKFCNFKVLYPAVISPCKYHKKKYSVTLPQVHPNINGINY